MKELRFFYVPQAEQTNELPPDEALHAVRVLRLTAGDELFLMDGQGLFYRAEVTLVTGKKCVYALKERLPQTKTWSGHIHLAIAPTKVMDRIEWLVEKATEIGIDEFSFLNCQFSERRHMREDRLDKIAVAAMKQSRKAWKPVVGSLMGFKEFIGQPRSGRKYIAHCHEGAERVDLVDELQGSEDGSELTLLVGPEGDFSPAEVQMAIEQGYQPVSLGKSRLRTETAGLYGVMAMQTALRSK